MSYFTYWSYNQPQKFVIHSVLKPCFLFHRATNETVSQQDTCYRKKLCVQRVSSFPFSHLFPFQISSEVFFTIVLHERDFFVCFLSNFAREVGENWSTRACSTLSHRVPSGAGGLSGKDLVRCSLCPSGNIHGNGQPHGTLMEPYVYLQTPLWEGIPLTIEVASPVGPTRYEGSAPLIT